MITRLDAKAQQTFFGKVLDSIAQNLGIKNYQQLKSKYPDNTDLLRSKEYSSIICLYDDVSEKNNIKPTILLKYIKQFDNCIVELKSYLDEIQIANNLLTVDGTIIDLLHMIMFIRNAFLKQAFKLLGKTVAEHNANGTHNYQPMQSSDIALSYFEIQDYYVHGLDYYAVLRATFKLSDDDIRVLKEQETSLSSDLIYSSQYALNGAKEQETDIEKAFNYLHKYKKSIPAYLQYWAKSNLFQNSNPSLCKHYFYKFKSEVDQYGQEDIFLLDLISGLARTVAIKTYNTSVDPNLNIDDIHKLAIKKDAIFYLQNAIKYGQLQIKAIKKLPITSLAEKQKINTMFAAAQEGVQTNEALLQKYVLNTFNLKEKCFNKLHCPTVTFSCFSRQSGEVFYDDPFAISVDCADQARVLLKSCLLEKINCMIDHENNPNVIIISNFITTPIAKIENALRRAEIPFMIETNENQNIQGNKPAVIENNSNNQANISVPETIPELTVTKTQRNKLKKLKNKKLDEPTKREVITNELKNKVNKPPLRIVWPGQNGEPDYIYDELDEESTGIYRLYGESAKGFFIRVNDDLHAVLSEKQHAEKLQMLEHLIDNRTVKLKSKGHTCFVLSKKKFKELSQKIDLDFSKQSNIPDQTAKQVQSDIPLNKQENVTPAKNVKAKKKKHSKPANKSEDSDTVNNNNNQTKDNTPNTEISASSITWIKARGSSQLRLFGSTKACVQKANSTRCYNLIEIDRAKFTKTTKKSSN